MDGEATAPATPLGISAPPLAVAPTNIAEHLAEVLGLKTDLAKAVTEEFIELVQLVDRKQQDYGSENLTKFGTTGVMIRASDKIERIVTLKKNKLGVNYESLADSWADLANYGFIGLVMEKGRWPRR